MSFIMEDKNVVCSLPSGTVLLTPDKATYGECRSGVTQMEAAYGSNGTKSGPLTQLPVLTEGQHLERNGLRCSAYNGGVACGNVSAGVGFFVARDRYELISKAAAAVSRHLLRLQKPRNLAVFLPSIE